MTTTLDAFLTASTSFLQSEQQAERDENYALLHTHTLHALCSAGHALRRLHVLGRCRSGAGGETIMFARDASVIDENADRRPLPDHKFGAGDTVTVAYTKTHTMPLVGGVVSICTATTISVVLDKHAPQPIAVDWDTPTNTFAIVRAVNDVTYRRLNSCLQQLRDYQSRRGAALVELCFNKHSSTAIYNGDDSPLSFFDTLLNDAQQMAVRFACNSHRPIAIIHGPPGTGKTQTLVEVVRQLTTRGERVLVCAPSNVAVDNLLARCTTAAPALRVCRLGHSARTHPHNVQFTLDSLLMNSEQKILAADAKTDLKNIRRFDGAGKRAARDLKQEVRERETAAVRQILDEANVVFATLTSSNVADYPLKLMQRPFDVVVIDECAQAIELACWLSLLQVPRCVLAGDDRQLAPTVLSITDVDTHLTLMGRLRCTMEQQLFRLLTVQYRMHDDIMRWSSREFYGDLLTAHESVRAHRIDEFFTTDDEHSIDGIFDPLVLVDTSNTDDGEELSAGDDESKCNVVEVYAVFAHLRRLIERGVRQQVLAVVSPYNLQVQLMRQYISPIYPNVSIRSVDGFQGQEAEVIVLSMVRANRECCVGFLSDARRLNVAVTRARRQLCVVACAHTLAGSDDAHCRSLIEYLRSTARVIDVHAELSDDLQNMPFIIDKSSLVDTPKQELVQVKTAKQQQVGGNNHKMLKGEPKGAGKRVECVRERLVETLGTPPTNIVEDVFVTGMSVQLADFNIHAAPGEHMTLSSLTGNERRLVHEMCEQLGLTHESHTPAGTEQRCLVVGKPGAIDNDKAHGDNWPIKPAVMAPSIATTQSAAKRKPKKTTQIKIQAASTTAVIDDDDALLASAIEANSRCTQPMCRTSIAYVFITCTYCRNRYCTSHALAEAHGCGQAARTAARNEFREQYARTGLLTAVRPARKPQAETRDQLLNKLHEKQKNLRVDLSNKKNVKK